MAQQATGRSDPENTSQTGGSTSQATAGESASSCQPAWWTKTRGTSRVQGASPTTLHGGTKPPTSPLGNGTVRTERSTGVFRGATRSTRPTPQKMLYLQTADRAPSTSPDAHDRETPVRVSPRNFTADIYTSLESGRAKNKRRGEGGPPDHLPEAVVP